MGPSYFIVKGSIRTKSVAGQGRTWCICQSVSSGQHGYPEPPRDVCCWPAALQCGAESPGIEGAWLAVGTSAERNSHWTSVKALRKESHQCFNARRTIAQHRQSDPPRVKSRFSSDVQWMEMERRRPSLLFVPSCLLDPQMKGLVSKALGLKF